MFSLSKAESGVVCHPASTYSTGTCFIMAKRSMFRLVFAASAACAVASLPAMHAAAATPPSVQISNGAITATVYLPDAEAGFYRGTRFDWAGVIGALEYRGHTFYAPWFTKTDAT